MKLLDPGLPFWCLMQIEDLDHALALAIEVDKVFALLLRAIDILLVPGTFWKDQDSALKSMCWNRNEVIFLGEDLIQELAQVLEGSSSICIRCVSPPVQWDHMWVEKCAQLSSRAKNPKPRKWILVQQVAQAYL